MKKMTANRRITIREVGDDVGISFGSCQTISKDVLAMKFQKCFEDLKKCWHKCTIQLQIIV